MDIITGQRTFCIGLSGLGSVAGAPDIVDIPFVDTAGNVIRCNYFKVTVSVGLATAKGAFIAELSGVSMEGDMVSNSLSALNTAVASSGICGVGSTYAGLGTSDALWHGSNGQICTGIRLQVLPITGTGVNALVEYGNLLPYNTLRSDSYDAGA
jgi:hypothetical protein